MDHAQFAVLVRDNIAFIIKALARFGVPAADLEDVAQEVFHGAYRSLPGYNVHAPEFAPGSTGLHSINQGAFSIAYATRVKS